jgi:uncharacterized protein (UPF0548 family)
MPTLRATRWHTKTTGCPVLTSTEEWDAKGLTYETLARAALAAAIEEKPAGRFTIRSRTRVVQRHPEGDEIWRAFGGTLPP